MGWYRLTQWLREQPAIRWLARFWFAQHNARVIEDFERRMSLVIEDATGGRMTKPYYSIEAMRAEMTAAREGVYAEGYSDCRSDHDLVEDEQ